MRVIKEIQHNDCRISVFQWNGKYLIKLEQGDMEQTYKVDQWDLTGVDDLDLILNDSFIQKAMTRFVDMNKDFMLAMKDV